MLTAPYNIMLTAPSDGLWKGALRLSMRNLGILLGMGPASMGLRFYTQKRSPSVMSLRLYELRAPANETCERRKTCITPPSSMFQLVMICSVFAMAARAVQPLLTGISRFPAPRSLHAVSRAWKIEPEPQLVPAPMPLAMHSSYQGVGDAHDHILESEHFSATQFAE